MNFLKYSDSRYQEILVESTEMDKHSQRRYSEPEAIQLVLSMYRLFWRLLYVPKVLASFLLVNLKLKSEPIARIDEIKAEEEKQELSRIHKQMKKVGIQPPKATS